MSVFYPDPRQQWLSWNSLRFGIVLVLVASAYGTSIWLTGFDPVQLIEGLPRLASWAARAWPLDLAGLGTLLVRAAQTCAMALIGTTLAGVLALPLSLVAAGNVSGLSPAVTIPVRWILNALRGTDSFIFAILFVAAVGLGPFAGVMGIAFHSTGSLAKLWSEAIEAVESGPLDAVRMTGANRVKLIAYALIPDIRPALISVALYVFEFNIRSSTVLGLVGAGGIGQDLKDSVDLLFFPRVGTIILVILAMVTIVDQGSAWLRRRVL